MPGRPRPPDGGNTIINQWTNNYFNRNRYRPGHGGWGYRPNDAYWGDHWYDRYVHRHHHVWYHGAWSGNWGGRWYVPLVYGATTWGLAAALPTWGYSYHYSYANPYYVASALPAYDYSRPIVINTYNLPASDAAGEVAPEQAAAAAAESPQRDEGYQFFDAARNAFSGGDYARALELTRRAVRSIADDPLVHEFGALCLFAQGDYSRAAAVLNAVLAAAPGMDWTTMSSLYPKVDTYTQQLRKLEAFTQQQPADAAARFVLAYHYLVAGHTDAAVDELTAVVASQPEDKVAQRMLESLQGPAETPPAPAQAPPAPAAPPAELASDADAEASTMEGTDLVGTWRAEREGDAFELRVDDDAAFVWKVTPKSGAPVEITGPLVATSDKLILESQDQGTMVANVTSLGADAFQFVAAGGPPDDEGLTFKRVK